MSLLDRVVGSRVNYWFGFAADGITGLFFLLCGVLANTGSWVSCAVAMAAGALSWGLLEYCGHRWFFHLPGSPAHKGHMRHHDEPDELFAMPWFATTIVAFALWFVLRVAIPDGPASFFMAALIAGYISYGTVHYVNHHININVLPGKLLKRSRANHRIHHKMPDTNYGVTTTFWDRVFGTHYQSKRIHAFQTLRVGKMVLWTSLSSPSGSSRSLGAQRLREPPASCSSSSSSFSSSFSPSSSSSSSSSSGRFAAGLCSS